ncbi:metallophosphoesterase [Sunxiuqinia elliptica]|uniref:Calcineurin-like phosphoesterase n=1 Tax=Sunxiuqinia elliptica TaxID=655355 RepID=A0A1I2KC50_9BACT|nr:metallophosphoesterase [Sunxiuqinia elliptica]SFF64625.1 Calcineurin-like phosphoesterase [Sunxiuqinia elliptica]
MIYRFQNYLLFALLVFVVSCTEKKQPPFSFVQLCDTQLGFDADGYEQDVKKFKQAVKQINELNPDFVVICGDLVNTPNDSSFSDFKDIMGGFTMPCYLTPGNHDITNTPDSTSLSYYRETIGKDYFEFEHKGYSFIVTNSQLWKAKVENESEKHDRWFKETLKNQGLKKQPVVVVGHYPLYTKTPEEEEAYFNFSLEKRQELLALFQQNNVRAYLSGHTHQLTINQYDNMQLVSGETTSKNFDQRPFGFRLWLATPDTLTQGFVPLQAELAQ